MFKRKKPVVTESYQKIISVPTKFPPWSVVETPEGTYLIQKRTMLKVFSERVAASWNFDTIKGTKDSLSLFTYAGPLGFRNGSVIQNMADMKFYYIDDSLRRHIVSPDFFDKYGFNIDNVWLVSEEETNLHKEGEPLK